MNNYLVLEQKFLQAQESDSNFNKLVERYENWMERFSGSDEDILELILLNSDSQFLSKNQKVIIEVSKLNKDFLNKISKIPNDLKKINDAFKRNDFYTSFVRIANNLVNKDDEFDKLMGEYINELEKIRDLVNYSLPILNLDI